MMYGCEPWCLNENDRHNLEVYEMKGLRCMSGVSKRDGIRKVRIREMCGWERGLMVRYEQGILKWYGHIMRLDKNKVVRRLFKDEVDVIRGRGREKKKFFDGV